MKAAGAAAAGATSSSGEKATEFHEHNRTHTSRLLGGVAAFTTTFIGFSVVSADTEGVTSSSEKKEADQNAFESFLKNAKEFVSQLTSRGSSYSLVSDEYRREVFFAYENRLREHSSMDKVFAYFASGKNANGETLMTKEDLIRSAIPVYQKTNIRSGSLEGEVVSEEEVEGKDVMETNVFKSSNPYKQKHWARSALPTSPVHISRHSDEQYSSLSANSMPHAPRSHYLGAACGSR